MLGENRQEAEIVAALRRVMRAIDLRSRALFQEVGLTGPQLLVLRDVARLTGRPVSTVARTVNLSQPTVSGILDRLERRGLVRRDRGEADRRTVIVTITAEGGRILRDAPSLLQDHFWRQLAELEGWEQTQILAILQRLASMMDAEAIDAAPVLATGPLAATAHEPRDAPAETESPSDVPAESNGQREPRESSG